MKIQKIIYMCDVCKEEQKEETDLTPVKLPYYDSDCEGRSFHVTYKNFDLCEKCKLNYERLIFNNFAVIRDLLGRITSDVKYNENGDTIN